MEIAIIGGGAAGFFSAITIKENYPDSTVIIFEKTHNVLSKVKISGGGRCNVTNASASIKQLSKAYPRGEKFLHKAFQIFNNKDVMQWFESKGVTLITQEDNCVFPKSQNSQSIIDCFMEESKNLGIEISLGLDVNGIKQRDNKLELEFTGKNILPRLFDKVIVSTGGSPKREGLDWLEKLGHKIEDPVPSLFTFNMPNESIIELMGIVVEKTIVSIPSTKLKSEGPLLITHWGMSGPAILKLSAFGARVLSEKEYDFNIQVNWVDEPNNDIVTNEIKNVVNKHPNKFMVSVKPYPLPERLWHFLLAKCEFPKDKKWKDLGKNGINKLVRILTNDEYSVKGKTTFKEEFVTCGGVSLESIDVKSMESKVLKNLYFAGEIIDIDGITGGYNFQAAWTTAFIAGKLN